LNPLNEDEKKLFHTTISHEDGNKLKSITNKTFDMIKELHNFLSFDYNKNDFLLRGIAEKESTKPSPGGIYYQ
jgi:hypothetical protein